MTAAAAGVQGYEEYGQNMVFYKHGVRTGQVVVGEDLSTTVFCLSRLRHTSNPVSWGLFTVCFHIIRHLETMHD